MRNNLRIMVWFLFGWNNRRRRHLGNRLFHCTLRKWNHASNFPFSWLTSCRKSR